MRKRSKKNKKFNINQRSFYFEDYLETNQKNKRIKKSNISQDRIYLLFFLFFSLITIFSTKIIFVSLKNLESYSQAKNSFHFVPLRRDIVDRNGILISRNVKSFHAAIKPDQIKNKESFLLNIKLNFPDLSLENLKNI